MPEIVSFSLDVTDDVLKALVWQEGGFWLCQKRLEAGTFVDPARWCDDGAHSVIVTPAQLHALLEGIDVHAAHYRVRQGYRVGNAEKFVKSRHGRAALAKRSGQENRGGRRPSARGTHPSPRDHRGSKADYQEPPPAHPRGEVGAG